MGSEAVEQVTVPRVCAIPAPGGFQALKAASHEQPGLSSELALLWAGGRTGDLLRSPPACDPQAAGTQNPAGVQQLL